MTPRRHHFIPRFYLERFASGDLLSVFDRDRNEFRLQSPINTAVLRDYYAFTGPDGSRNVEVEQALAVLEGETKPILTKLDSRESLTQREKESLATFVALQETRTPEFERGVGELLSALAKGIARTAFANLDRARASLARLEKSTRKVSSSTAEEMVDFAKGDAYTVRVNRTVHLASMLALAPDLARILLSLRWTFLHASQEAPFIASDSPFIVLGTASQALGDYGVGILTPGALKFVPLGAHLGMLMTEPSHNVLHVTAPQELVHQLNANMTVRSERYLFSHDSELLRHLVDETQLRERTKLPKVQTF
jgi:hypothetical protein